MSPASLLTGLLGLCLFGLSGASCSEPQVVYHINQGSEYPRLEAQNVSDQGLNLSPVVARFLINTGPDSCPQPLCYQYLGTPIKGHEEEGLRRLVSAVNQLKTSPDGPAKPIKLVELEWYTGNGPAYRIPVEGQAARFPALAGVAEPAKAGESPYIGQFLVDLGQRAGANRYLAVPRAAFGDEYQFARVMVATMNDMAKPKKLATGRAG